MPRRIIITMLLLCFAWTVRGSVVRVNDSQRPPLQPALVDIFFEPKSVFLFALGEPQRMIVSGRYADDLLREVTHLARFSSNDNSIAEIDSEGIVRSRGYGVTRIKATVLGRAASALVVVRNWNESRTINFNTDVAPVLSRVGCNGSSCHGALNGQNGFKLSLFGYEPDADYQAIVQADSGRRLELGFPEESLLLLKPTHEVTHGGGKLITKVSPEYRVLYDWIAAGAPQGEAGGPRLARLYVYPQDQRILTDPNQKQQLVVVGKYSDGREVDMTHEVRYLSSDDTIAQVSPYGVVSARREGEADIMVRSLGAVGAARIAVVFRPPLADHPELPRRNFIDDLVFEKLARLRVVPSEICTDSEFIRRVYLDLIGTLPTPKEVSGFLADSSSDKRTRLIDSLFSRPEYADLWSLKWGDLLTNTPQFLYNGTAYFQAWLRQAFAQNMPYDRLARELLTASGGTYQTRPSNFYAVGKKPEDMATFVSQVFMGVSLECARCHDHPSEKWKRDDFLGLAAFFSQVKFKGGVRNNERFLYIDPEKEFKHPETKQVVPARFPGAFSRVEFPRGEDRRARLAEWLTSPSNPYFAAAVVNRVWSEFMGRGFVDPVDDFRVTNPPTNGALLDRLAADFVGHGFDLQHLMKRILTSRAYQLSARTNPTNQNDQTGYSHYRLRRLTAEQLADALSQVTGVPEKYPAFYPGKRAIQLPDPIIDSYFLTIFDRATRENATCTRKQTASVAQSLNLVSGESINGKLRSDRGKLAQLVGEGKTNDEIVEYFCLAAWARYPAEREKVLARESIALRESRREGLEDFVWALLNSKEFLYNH